jgi:hypothetical protein
MARRSSFHNKGEFAIFFAKHNIGLGVKKITKNPKDGRKWVNVSTKGVFYGNTRDEVRSAVKVIA